MTRPRETCCSIVTLAMEFCFCVVNPEIDGPTRKCLIPNRGSMRPPSWLEIAQSGVLPGRGALRAFCARLSQRQQRDDVARRQWRIGAVREGEAAGGTGKIESDLILADRRRRFDVEHGIEAERIREINVAARDRVLVAPEVHFSRQQVNVAKENRMLPGAAQAQVGVRLKPRTAPLPARIGSGVGLNIKL